MTLPERIAVIGLGYVGLPLAVALARHFEVVGIDADAGRIAALGAGRDATGEVSAADLAASRAAFAADPAAMAGADLFIVAVPTPVDAEKRPDLSLVRAAMADVGRQLRAGATVVLESTVWPGATEEVCRPILERESGLAGGRDFFLGYSPERTNPGDRQHGLADLVKVVAGETAAVTGMLAAVYGRVTGGKIFVARNIRTAEAAKAIENAQRDINIAFVNEVAMICARLGLSTGDVLDAARTKWNFLPFAPGLVGGHCIGVDPYYLAHRAAEAGHEPAILLAGRRINDGMSGFAARAIDAALGRPSDILVLGLAFKENVPDLRNSGAAGFVHALAAAGHRVAVHDSFADPQEARHEHGIDLVPDLAGGPFDAVVGAVAHAPYCALGAADLAGLLRTGGLLADIRGMWRALSLPAGFRRWSL